MFLYFESPICMWVLDKLDISYSVGRDKWWKIIDTLIWEDDDQVLSAVTSAPLKTKAFVDSHKEAFLQLMDLNWSTGSYNSHVNNSSVDVLLCCSSVDFIGFSPMTVLLVYFLLSREMVTLQFTVLISEMQTNRNWKHQSPPSVPSARLSGWISEAAVYKQNMR